jgi:hypothetical protein
MSILPLCLTKRPRTRAGPGWRGGAVIAAAAMTVAAAGAVLVTGCSAAGTGSRSSVTACAQYGMNAIRHHVTVTTIPADCRGLSQIDVNVAVARALHAAAAGVHGKARERRLIARDSQYLSGLVRTGTGARQAPAPVTAAAAAPPSQAAFGWATLAAWLVTAGLGVSVMARWVSRPARARDGGRMPVLNYAHFGLAIAGLLTWAGYLASSVTALAWAGCGLLLPTAGLGMTLVFLGPARDAAAAPDITGLAAAELSFDGPATPRPGALVIAAHIAAASITILLAVLAAIGSR